MYKKVIFAACLLIFGCAGHSRMVQNPDPDKIMRDFHDGEIILKCDSYCYGTWLDERQALGVLYAKGRWKDLVVGVTSIGFKEDLGYFWLGRAAEGLGDFDNALIYYNISYIIHRDKTVGSCKATPRGTCFGIDISGDTDTRAAEVKRQIALRTAAIQVPAPVPALNLAPEVHKSQPAAAATESGAHAGVAPIKPAPSLSSGIPRPALTSPRQPSAIQAEQARLVTMAGV